MTSPEAATQRSGAREQARQVANTFVPILLGALVIFAAMPREWLPEKGPIVDARNRVSDAFRLVSLSQSWRMYAPDASRSHFYLTLDAIHADGTREALPESALAETGWGTQWIWTKNHLDVLRHQVGQRGPDEPSLNRTWYLRGICVREAKLGKAPERIEMGRVKRKFRRPDQVRAGKAALGPPERVHIETVNCRSPVVRAMIEHANARAEGRPFVDSRKKGRR